MSIDSIGRSIFVVNTFASAHPEQHVALWARFEADVPASERNAGFYGSDSAAYYRWLKKNEPELINGFISNTIEGRAF